MSEVIFEIKKNTAIATLNAPSKLNSINLEMIDAIYEQLCLWETEDEIHQVILKGAGPKAFCAGGDVKSLYMFLKNKPLKEKKEYAQKFFEHEYRLDLKIHQFKKPIICFAHGVTMGGGIGLMNGARYRIVTETTMMSMPEITIGLYPDVGASYFLSKMPGEIGKFLGLSAFRFLAADALFLEMADFFVLNEKIPKLEEEIINYETDLDNILKEYHDSSLPHLKQGVLKNNQLLINALFQSDNLLKIKEAIDHCDNKEEWLLEAQKNFVQGSPTTAHIVIEQLKRAAHMSLPQVFEMEVQISVACCLGEDFYEGVRALLVDKDKNPKWSPATLEDFDKSFLASYFGQ